MRESAVMTSMSNIKILHSKLVAETEHVQRLQAQSAAKNGLSIARWQQRLQETTARYEHALEQNRLQEHSNQ